MKALGPTGLVDNGNRAFSLSNRGPGLFRHRHSGTAGQTTGTAADRWYVAGLIGTTNAGATAAQTIGTLKALPYYTGRGGTITALGVNVTTAGGTGSVLRFGVYSNISDDDVYPNALLYDSGSIVATTTGMKTTTPNLVLPVDDIVWFHFNCGVAAPTMRVISSTAAWPLLGVDATLNIQPGFGWEVAQAFATIPSTFPAGASVTTAGSVTPPMIGARIA